MVPQRTDLREEIVREFHCSHFGYASRWHEDVPRSSSLVLLKRDEATRWRFCSTLSHVSIGMSIKNQ